MRITTLLCLPLLAGSALAAPAEKPVAKEAMPAPTPDTAVLVKLKTLVGEWQAPMGDRTATVTYKATGGGKCVAETLAAGTPHEMLTLYCADGRALVATHYCAGGTQPRMQAEGLSADGQTIDFKFKDITNLGAPDAPHMRTVKFTWQGDKIVTQEWGGVGPKGKPEPPMVFRWTRVK